MTHPTPETNRTPPAEGYSSAAVAGALLHCKELAIASDADALVAAAAALLHSLEPDAAAWKEALSEHSQIVSAPGSRASRFALPDDQAIAIARPSGDGGEPVWRAVTAFIELQARMLRERSELARSVAELDHSELVQRAMYAIADQANAAGTDLTPMFQALHQIIGTLMFAENLYIARYDRSRDQVRFVYYADSVDTNLPSPDQELPLAAIANGPTWHVLRGGVPLRGSMDEIEAQVSAKLSGVGAVPRDWLGVPLFHDREVVGCVAVQSYDQAHRYTEQDQSLLTFVAQHVQTALERRRARAELEHQVMDRTAALRQANAELEQEVERRRHGELLQGALFQLAELASTSDRIEDFYAAAHRIVGTLLYAENLYVALVSADGVELTFPYWVDERHGDFSPRRLDTGHGLTEYVIKRGSPVLVDATEIERLRASDAIAQPPTGAMSWLGVPLRSDQQVLGVLAVQSYSAEHHYTDQDRDVLAVVGYHIANALARIRAKASLRATLAQLESRIAQRTRELATANEELRTEIAERKRAEGELQKAAMHDPLTKLPNRTLFRQRLERALARPRSASSAGCAVLFVDLDGFKGVNDTEGHFAGDELLSAVGARIHSCVKDTDTVARLGGDEFGVILDNVRGASDACRVADRIIAQIRSPFHAGTKAIGISASVGVAMPREAERDPDGLLRAADAAMYQAKQHGGSRWELYDATLSPMMQVRLRDPGNRDSDQSRP